MVRAGLHAAIQEAFCNIGPPEERFKDLYEEISCPGNIRSCKGYLNGRTQFPIFVGGKGPFDGCAGQPSSLLGSPDMGDGFCRDMILSRVQRGVSEIFLEMASNYAKTQLRSIFFVASIIKGEGVYSVPAVKQVEVGAKIRNARMPKTLLIYHQNGRVKGLGMAGQMQDALEAFF